MIDRQSLTQRTSKELLSLALCVENFNIQFFNHWANRLRTYDDDAVGLLNGLAVNARYYRNALMATSQRLFAESLPAVEPEEYAEFKKRFELPDDRYFVVTDSEAHKLITMAQSMQRDSVALLTLIDQAMLREFGRGYFEFAETDEHMAVVDLVQARGANIEAIPTRLN